MEGVHSDCAYWIAFLWFIYDNLLTLIMPCYFAERVGAEVVECACVIELPELKVQFASSAPSPCLDEQNVVHNRVEIGVMLLLGFSIHVFLVWLGFDNNHCSLRCLLLVVTGLRHATTWSFACSCG
jgi:hypothetical protein